MQKIFPKIKNLDYVAAWYKKAADFMTNSTARAAFVSTNSISQGETVTALWKNLFAAHIHIDFAHRTFIWDSESAQKAHVHCVIVGFSHAPDIFVESRPKHLQNFVPPMKYGNKPVDGGFFMFTPDELAEFLKKEPAAEKFIRQIMGADEFINGKLRYCL